MPTLIECPSCRRQLQVPDELVGRKVKCPGCGLVFTTARPGEAAPPAYPSAESAEGASPPEPALVRPAPAEKPSHGERGYPDDEPFQDWEDEGSSQRARAQLIAPAICLMISGILGILGDLYLLASFRFTPREMMVKEMRPGTPEEKEIQLKVLDFIQGDVMLALNVIFMAVSVVVFLAGVMMLMRRMRWLAVTGSILALVNFDACCCLLGVPFGIWSLVVLSRPEVKAVFR
jgi:hypothetical protein